MDPKAKPVGSPSARQVPDKQETNPPPGNLPFITLLPAAARNCKCYNMLMVPNEEIREMMNDRDREAAQNGVWYLANRCAYFTRAVGCRLGDFCAYCHVHPMTAREQSSAGQKWSHVLQRWVSLGKKERKARNKMLQETQPWRERLLLEKRILLERLRDDCAHNDPHLSPYLFSPPPDPPLAVADAA